MRFLRTVVRIGLAAVMLALADLRAVPPNIVVILADDLGWSDLGAYGADLHETPHLDRLAREGVRFTHAYAPAPVCTPSRASLLTGKAPARLGMTTWSESALQPPTDRRLLDAPSKAALPLSEATLATHLRNAGYVTALVGKWHLGEAANFPEAHGFDWNIGGTHWGAPATYFFPYRSQPKPGAEIRYVPGLAGGRAGEYLTDRLTDEALRVLDRIQRGPFLLYFAHHAPHTPIEAKPEDIAHFRSRIRPGMLRRNPAYAAMVRSLDESVGRVVEALAERGLARNTVLVFASDNGGYLSTDRWSGGDLPITTNAPLRSGKGTCYEGGLRVPLLIRWPGVTRSNAVCAEPVVLTDLFPTLLAAGGLTNVPSADGLDLRPLLENPAGRLPREALHFHYPHHYHAPPTEPMGAIRTREWKLIEHFADGRHELFRLADDPGEAHDLASARPELVGELSARLREWRTAVGAQLPRANPGYRSTAP